MAASAESLAGDAAAALRSLDEVETINSRLDDYPATIEFLHGSIDPSGLRRGPGGLSEPSRPRA